jgi:flavin-dependent dehydrogenase
MREPQIVIIGGGPAGLSTALYLLKLAPSLKDRLIILEKASYPRNKICAGGLIPRALKHLEALGIPLSIPHVRIDATLLALPSGEAFTVESPAQGVVISRRDFDAHLAAELKSRGAQIHEGVRVFGMETSQSGLTLATERGDVSAEIVVGADGTGSIVRRSLFAGPKEVSRTVMKNIPVSPERAEFQRAVWRFEFTPVARGIQGYTWFFPTVIDGKSYLNVGLYDRNYKRARRYPLAQALNEALIQERLEASSQLCSFPIREYRRQGRLSLPHVLLVGDAGGADPLMGEGISFAFDYGRIAAREIVSGLFKRDLSFKRYGYHVWRDFGWRLTLLGFISSRLYGKRSRFWFSLARKKSLQHRAAMWYLGLRSVQDTAGHKHWS